MYDTPEGAAAGSLGEAFAVDASADGRWAVIVGRHRQSLGFVLCRSAHGGWFFEDEVEMTRPRGSVRSTWISTVDFDEADGPNVGVEISWGVAPSGAVRAVLGSGDEELTASVRAGSFWFVRWCVPDPAENDEDRLEHIRFAGE
jgi:hypothetical protein